MQETSTMNRLALFGGQPAFEEKLHVGRPNIGDRQRFQERVTDILDRRWLTNAGPYVKQLEKEIAELTKEKELVDLRLNSGREPFEELQKLSNRIGEIAELLDKKEMRWLELSDLVQ